MCSFTLIGLSDCRSPWFPPEVEAAIRDGHVFAGGRRHHELVADRLPADAVWVDIVAPMTSVFAQLDAFPSVVVFASGDPLFYGFAATVQRLRPSASIRLFPSFNSLQTLAHRLLMPYHDLRVVSLTGRPWPSLDCALIERAPKVGVLTDRVNTPAAVARRMLDYGYAGYVMHVGEHLGNPERERVTTLTLGEAAERTFDAPNCFILHASSLPPRPFGLPDAAFDLLDGREKMITKMPIRLLTLQVLGLPRRRVLWDIGFCTGSVSIEARLQFPHLHVEAFEVRPECEALMAANARRFGAPGIEVHIGDFLDIPLVTAVPQPDAVFIGGHGGRLKEIMAKVCRHLAPGGCIVLNSVASPVVERCTHRPGSRQLFAEACAEQGLQQASPLHVVLDDYNPIDILQATKP